jgi:site-specific DNA recombinase
VSITVTSTTDAPVAALPGSKQGVLYLRVSSRRQMDTAIDIDPDGNSIATQREVSQAKSNAMSVEMVKEFLEPGNSAQTIEKRPVFREMLSYLSAHPEVKYVFVYMRSRAFRNYIDAGVTERQLAKLGVKLVSAKEDFGEGIWADAMKGVADIMNEVQVRMSGEDIKVKLQHKAMNGGTIGRAKLGYLNTRTDVDGRLVNTIGLDPARAPLVRQAWELYATGDYSLDALSEVMADQGLATRPSARWPAQAVSVNKLSQMLRDPYYTGVMVYKGEIIPEGRHEAIVSQALFERVQEIMDSRQQRGSRSRIHHHYLKGMLYCQRCHQAGRTCRLIFTEGLSHTGTRYGYFKCRGRQEGVCDLPHLPVWLVEESIEKTYATLPLADDFTDEVRHRLDACMQDEQRIVRETHTNLTKELATLDTKEERLLDLAEDDSLPRAKVKERLRAIQLERARIRESMQDTSQQLALGAQVLRAALDLVSDPERLYLSAPDDSRQRLNQTFYTAFYLDDRALVTAALKPPFDDLHSAAEAFYRNRHAGARAERRAATNKHPDTAGRSKTPKTPSLHLADVFSVNGWSKRVLVGATGIEPVTARV